MSLATIATANHPIRKPYFNDMQACCAGCVTSPEPTQVRQLTHNFSALTMKSLTLPDRQGRQWRSTKATQNSEGQIRMQLRNQSNQRSRMQTWNDSFFHTSHVAAAAMPQPMQATPVTQPMQAAAGNGIGGRQEPIGPPTAKWQVTLWAVGQAAKHNSMHTLLQRFSPTLLYNTLLKLFSTTTSPTLLYNPLPQHFLPTLLYKTLLQRFSTALFSDTSLQHFSTTLFGDICPALLCNTLLQLISTTLFSNSSLQRLLQLFSTTSSPTLLCNQQFLFNASLQTSCATLLYSTLLRHSSATASPTLLYNTLLRLFSTTSSPTLPYNTLPQHFLPTLLYKTLPQHSSAHPSCVHVQQPWSS